MIEENKTTYQQLLQCAEQSTIRSCLLCATACPQQPSVVMRWQEQLTLNIFDVKETIEGFVFAPFRFNHPSVFIPFDERTTLLSDSPQGDAEKHRNPYAYRD